MGPIHLGVNNDIVSMNGSLCPGDKPNIVISTWEGGGGPVAGKGGGIILCLCHGLPTVWLSHGLNY